MKVIETTEPNEVGIIHFVLELYWDVIFCNT